MFESTLYYDPQQAFFWLCPDCGRECYGESCPRCGRWET